MGEIGIFGILGISYALCLVVLAMKLVHEKITGSSGPEEKEQ